MRLACRDIFRQTRLLERIIPDIEAMLAAEGFHYHIVMDQGRISEGTSPELILPSDDETQLDLLSSAQPTAEEPTEDADPS